MRANLLIILLCVFSNVAMSQTKQDSTGRHSAAYLELLGNGLGLSVNFEYPFANDLSARIGIFPGSGSFGVGSDSVSVKGAIVPLMIEYTGSHRLELGVGLGIVAGTVHTPKHADHSLDAYATFAIGYALRPNENGILFKIALTPILGLGQTWILWPGISLGYQW